MTEQTTRKSTLVQPFVVWVDGEEDRPYPNMNSARRRANQLFADNSTACVIVWDKDRDKLKFKLEPEATEEESMEQVEQVKAQEQAREERNTNSSAGTGKTNDFGVKDTVLTAAGFALQRKAITQDQYTMICRGESTLDEAKAQIASGEVEKPKKKRATANPDKKTKQRAKGKGNPNKGDEVPKEPKYTVTTLKEVREKAGYNPSKLYKEAGLKKDLVWHMEKKNRAVTMAELEAIATVLDCKVEHFGPVAK